MGTVNLLESARCCESVGSVLNVTTDKVYQNMEWPYGYRETDVLNGCDPYSNSKSCSELVTDCYKKAFFAQRKVAVSTVRAGNVIGGGDFSENRIVPDCYRAFQSGERLSIRNPCSVRPYQHVLEPSFMYLYIAAKQIVDGSVEGSYNIGPDDSDCVTTLEIAELYKRYSGNIDMVVENTEGPHEANVLRLDCSKARATFGWRAQWGIDDAMRNTVGLYACIARGAGLEREMAEQIGKYALQFEKELS
jgi:CDP-glucose 4,6-dehydratase